MDMMFMLNDTITVPERKRIKFTSQASVSPSKSQSSIDVFNSGASVFSSRKTRMCKVPTDIKEKVNILLNNIKMVNIKII